ncbi:MAG TPA: hypothetical protein VEO95_00585, partial [Chthoniobacteraceae bacterium]|nr:hypothetical protein [Chthoniobacteraceae bacterium]
MKPSAFLSWYEKLEHLVQRLPAPLQQPILREITPIKTLFLLQRAPRLVLLGASGVGKVELVNALFSAEALRPGEENLSDGSWQEIGRAGRGTFKLLDARRPASLNMLRAALAEQAPDLFLFVGKGAPPDEDRDHAQEILAFAESQHGSKPRLLGVLAAAADSGDPERARQELHAALHARAALSDRMVGTLALTTSDEIRRLAELIAIELPGEAQLEM